MKRVLAAAVVIVALGACGGSKSNDKQAAATTTTVAPTTTAPFNPDTAKADITTLYNTVFNDKTTTDQAVELIEDGPALRPAIDQQRTSGAANGLTANVKSIQFQSEILADVNFDILIKGAVVAPNTKGQAKFLDGRWKVNEQLFCTLLGLAGQHPTPCAKFG
ncbi:MAG: hypothetical protein QOJ09_389 [Actinomycetota bacterium]|jgi:hypothetical protein|nr:hypothetical protein [Actinomycetota bacterium]